MQAVSLFLQISEGSACTRNCRVPPLAWSFWCLSRFARETARSLPFLFLFLLTPTSQNFSHREKGSSLIKYTLFHCLSKFRWLTLCLCIWLEHLWSLVWECCTAGFRPSSLTKCDTKQWVLHSAVTQDLPFLFLLLYFSS